MNKLFGPSFKGMNHRQPHSAFGIARPVNTFELYPGTGPSLDDPRLKGGGLNDVPQDSSGMAHTHRNLDSRNVHRVRGEIDMTPPDELRAQAIDAIKQAIKLVVYGSAPLDDPDAWEILEDEAIAALEGLGRAGFWVLGPKVSGDMIGTCQSCEDEGMSISGTFLAMAAVGDLTGVK